MCLYVKLWAAITPLPYDPRAKLFNIVLYFDIIALGNTVDRGNGGSAELNEIDI